MNLKLTGETRLLRKTADPTLRYMDHEHVDIIVRDAHPAGTEQVPARRHPSGAWELLKSPLYATELAAGDLIKIQQVESGLFELIARGGNVCVQFYLDQEQADSSDSTERVERWLKQELRNIDGRVDGTTPGLITCTIPVSVGFAAIERTFSKAEANFLGSQWQYANIYDPITEEPIGWWE